MSMPTECPSCGETLVGRPIPADKITDYGATHWSLVIGVYDMARDRTMRWLCPHCQHVWDRNQTISAK